MNDLKSWLSAKGGRATALARHLDVTLARVSQMAVDGVPVKYMAAVRDFTGGDVSLESLVAQRTPSKEAA